MGITRIVGGEMINTSTSMHLSATDGNFEFHAAGKNQWQGEENGIVFGDYKPPHKEDVLDRTITVHLNLFFDGTQNNKTNTEARNENSPNHKEYQAIGNKNDDSFENDYTNVARAFDAIDPDAQNQVRVYIEGQGTENLKKDSMLFGVGMGEGDTGITAKVTKGCMDAAKQMEEKGYNKKHIDVLYVNVYGFSRGAAAARHFIHVASKMAEYGDPKEISEGKYKYHIMPDYFFNDKIYQFDLTLETPAFIDQYGYFGACLLNKGMKIKEIHFNFVGIYDTVSSHGVYHDNDVSDLKLDSIKKARHVFHIASEDEYRENFDLTSIKSAGLRGFELMLPGVHSDIGGSYLNDVEEISVIDNYETSDTEDAKNTAKYKKEKQYDAFKKIVVEEGWFKDEQLQKQFFYEKDLDKFAFYTAYQHNYGLVGRRKLFNTYDKVSLKLMTDESKRFEVIYKATNEKKNAINDDFINRILNQLAGYINACATVRNEYVDLFKADNTSFEYLSRQYYSLLKEIHYLDYVDSNDLKKLRNEYLHWSVKTNLFGLAPRVEGALPQQQRKREIHNG
jgi:hypothetical protein